jgi:hypothetical protein
MSNQIETYVYESPDGGDTIYRRPMASTQRELYRISDQKSTLIDDLRKSKLWGEIHRSAQSDPVLKDMLDQVEVYHTLKNSPRDR